MPAGKTEDRTVGQQIDSAIAKTEQKADEAKADVKSDMANAKAATERATDQVAQKLENAADKVGAGGQRRGRLPPASMPPWRPMRR